MTETFEQAVVRITREVHPQGGAVAPRELSWIEDEARHALLIQDLPELKTDSDGRYRCPAATEKGRRCSKFLQQNRGTHDDAGYFSLNCTYHGWVGKWHD